MEWLLVCLFIAIVVLAGLLYLMIGVFRVSVLDRRDHRHEELEFLSKMGNSLPAKYLIGGRTCEKIRALNMELKMLAKRQGVQFVDMTDLLTGEDGQLKREYTLDGLHVNEQAYRKIAARLIPLLGTGKEEEYAG